MNKDEHPWGSGPGWRFLQASNSLVVLRINPAGKILAANPYAEKLVGTALQGRDWHSILIDFSGTTNWVEWLTGCRQAQLLNVRTAGGLPQTFEVSVEALGTDFLLFGEVNANDQAMLSREVLELNHELNNLSRDLALKHDDLIKTQNQLLQSEKMAAIGQLAAGMAHEINNPVGFVKSNLGALQRYLDDLARLLQAYASTEPLLDAASRETLARIKQEIDFDYLQDDLHKLFAETFVGVQRVQDIVRDLKTFSHVDEPAWSWANPEIGIDSVLSILSDELQGKHALVKAYAGLPEIFCAPLQLNQVFMNLLLNARQAMVDGGQIAIRTGFSDSEIWVEIADTGRGIAPEHLGHIFEPFFTTQPVGKGKGLGLSLAYGIVKRHGGRIEVVSRPGEGAQFKVCLPRRSEPSTAQA